jgi:hypothetical protein
VLRRAAVGSAGSRAGGNAQVACKTKRIGTASFYLLVVVLSHFFLFRNALE